MNGKYFNQQDLKKLTTGAEDILMARNKIRNIFKIDILNTDNISKLMIYKIYHQYDSTFKINFAKTEKILFLAALL